MNIKNSLEWYKQTQFDVSLGGGIMDFFPLFYSLFVFLGCFPCAVKEFWERMKLELLII